jgi:hypothetical protein
MGRDLDEQYSGTTKGRKRRLPSHQGSGHDTLRLHLFDRRWAHRTNDFTNVASSSQKPQSVWKSLSLLLTSLVTDSSDPKPTSTGIPFFIHGNEPCPVKTWNISCYRLCTMHEIVTLQLGQRANYLATHFWNAQESYFTYSDFEEPVVDHDVHFRAGLGADGAETYTPRTIIYDLKGGFGTLRKYNALYQIENEDAATQNLWCVR